MLSPAGLLQARKNQAAKQKAPNAENRRGACCFEKIREQARRSSDRIETMAVPAAGNWLPTTAPKNASSPTARKRGKAEVSVMGLLVRTSALPDPKRERRSPATAMMR